MTKAEPTDHPILREMVSRLEAGAGDALQSVVLYGAAARGDFHSATGERNLLIVTRDLELTTLKRLSGPLDWWLRKRQAMPRIFSPGLIVDSADVFPIEFIDIRRHHVVLYGSDPFTELDVRRDHLRLQCEREIREKMMRLREAYIQTEGRPKHIKRLLIDSYEAFVNLFRGCLELMTGETPTHDEQVVDAFCSYAGIEPTPFHEAGKLADGEKVDSEPRDLFFRYYAALTTAVSAVDRFSGEQQ